jgi:hypothetical protein
MYRSGNRLLPASLNTGSGRKIANHSVRTNLSGRPDYSTVQLLHTLVGGESLVGVADDNAWDIVVGRCSTCSAGGYGASQAAREHQQGKFEARPRSAGGDDSTHDILLGRGV